MRNFELKSVVEDKFLGGMVAHLLHMACTRMLKGFIYLFCG